MSVRCNGARHRLPIALAAALLMTTACGSRVLNEQAGARTGDDQLFAGRGVGPPGATGTANEAPSAAAPEPVPGAAAPGSVGAPAAGAPTAGPAGAPADSARTGNGPATATGPSAGPPAQGRTGATPAGKAPGNAAAPKAAGPAAPSGGGGRTLKLGGIYHRTGAISYIMEPCYKGLSAFLADANERGGINGYRFQYVAYDDGMDPQRAQALMKRLIEQDKVDAVVGNCSDFSAEAEAGETTKVNIPVVGPVTGGSLTWYSTPNWFPVYGDQQPLYPKLSVETMKTQQIRKGAVLYPNVPSGAGGASWARKYLRQAGIEIVYDSAFSLVEADFTSYVSRMKAAGVEGIVFVSTPDILFRYFDAARQQGFSAKVFGPWPTYDPVLLKAGDAVEGNLFVTMPHLGLDTARPTGGADRMLTAAKRYFPDQSVNSPFIQGWSAGEVFAEGLNRLGDSPFASDAFMTALRTLKNWEGSTFLPPLTFVDGPNKQPAMCQQVLEVKGGKFQVRQPTFHCVTGY